MTIPMPARGLERELKNLEGKINESHAFIIQEVKKRQMEGGKE